MITAKIKRNILLATLSVSLVSGLALYAEPVEAATTQYKTEAERQAAIKETKAKIAELKAERDRLQGSASKASNSTTNGSEDAVSFTERINKILSEYHATSGHNNYSRFLQDGKTASEPTFSDSTRNVKSDEAMPSVPPPSKPPAPPKSLVSEGRYNFDWRGTPLPQSLYAVAKLANKGVVVNGKDLEGTVYMSLKQVTCTQALDYLSRAFNFNWMTDGNNIIISDEEKMKQSKIFDVAYANKDNLKEEFKALGIDEENIYVNVETGSISVTGTPYQLSQAEARLKTLDRPVSQCLLLAQLIEIQHGKERNLGFSYSLPTYSHIASTTADTDTLHGNWIEKLTFGASATASRELSKGKVIARPMIMSLNGQEGTVEFGDKVPILTKTDTGSSTSVTVTYESIGTNLKMTPIINEKSGDITVNIEAEVSNITSWITSNDTKAPQVSTRKAKTSAHLKSGQSFVIGGLMSSSDLDNLSGIPGLMNLPILGELFKYHTHSKSYGEVYIMITPYIVADDFDPTRLYTDLKKNDTKFDKKWEDVGYGDVDFGG